MASFSSYSETAGNNNATPPDGAPENQAPSTVNNVMREMMARARQSYANKDAYFIAGGSANVYSAVLGSITSLSAGHEFNVQFPAANTSTTPTLNSVTIQKNSAALAGGDIANATNIYKLVYDGTNFQLINPAVVQLNSSNTYGPGTTQNLADGTLQRPVLKDYGETLFDGSAGAAGTLSLENGNVFVTRLTANHTVSFANPPGSGINGGFKWFVKQNSVSAFTITWPSSALFPGSSSPTLTTTLGRWDVFAVETNNGGTTWAVFTVGQNLNLGA